MLVGAVGYSYSTNSKPAQCDPEFKEYEIDFAGELKDGDMRELKYGPGDEDKVLISRY